MFLKNEKEILTSSPTDGVRVEVIENSRGAYNRQEIQRLIASLNSYSCWRRDYFLTLVFTGARRGEIAAICKSHIRRDEETGRWYIFIEDGKTKHAQRRIPLHRKLEKLILARIRTLKATDLVFGDLPTYEQIGLEWHSIMQQSEVQKLSEFGKKRTLHSLRHTFVSEAMTKALHPIVQICVGHAITKTLGISGNYTHPETMALEKFLPAVDCIDW
ncbi:tyrosine-type recombinase/integrase [uncultured Cedecea sp.]|uniref:tyrosine-type recombinase/integrase n=1 Tax=uncultured Cedecea sp. TaxID=988762 RepID=UPI002613D6B9|nr:tyrosine-type recombinase/integrase [uncultured Cedecea sp.]